MLKQFSLLLPLLAAPVSGSITYECWGLIQDKSGGPVMSTPASTGAYNASQSQRTDRRSLWTLSIMPTETYTGLNITS